MAKRKIVVHLNKAESEKIANRIYALLRPRKKGLTKLELAKRLGLKVQEIHDAKAFINRCRPEWLMCITPSGIWKICADKKEAMTWLRHGFRSATRMLQDYERWGNEWMKKHGLDPRIFKITQHISMAADHFEKWKEEDQKNSPPKKASKTA